MNWLYVASLLSILLAPVDSLGYLIDGSTSTYNHFHEHSISWLPSQQVYYERYSGNDSGLINGSFKVIPETGESSDAIAIVSITFDFIESLKITSSNFIDINVDYMPIDLPDPITVTVSTLINEYNSFSWYDFSDESYHAGIHTAFDGYPIPIDKSLYASANLYSDYKSLTSLELVSVNPIPEPTTLFLFATGLASFVGLRLRKNNISHN